MKIFFIAFDFEAIFSFYDRKSAFVFPLAYNNVIKIYGYSFEGMGGNDTTKETKV
ncbi:hypothetical protein AM1BK_18580 [Neobacillus kokaensis]|uniref:Uncharacterized protein n=1 Tax=Neobacillus kokaensis TaxID=2759023 RepID=A0ABQ3N057_9BACI|nr:hypothetical protein AM1BK_18580 [Neobacillus kokaensis]